MWKKLIQLNSILCKNFSCQNSFEAKAGKFHKPQIFSGVLLGMRKEIASRFNKSSVTSTIHLRIAFPQIYDAEERLCE